MFDDDKVMIVVRVRRWCCQHSSAQDMETGAGEEEIEILRWEKSPSLQSSQNYSVVRFLSSHHSHQQPMQRISMIISFENCSVPHQETWLTMRGGENVTNNDNDDAVMLSNKDNDDSCGLIRKSLQSMTPISVCICRPSINIPDLNKGNSQKTSRVKPHLDILKKSIQSLW